MLSNSFLKKAVPLTSMLFVLNACAFGDRDFQQKRFDRQPSTPCEQEVVLGSRGLQQDILTQHPDLDNSPQLQWMGGNRYVSAFARMDMDIQTLWDANDYLEIAEISPEVRKDPVLLARVQNIGHRVSLRQTGHPYAGFDGPMPILTCDGQPLELNKE